MGKKSPSFGFYKELKVLLIEVFVVIFHRSSWYQLLKDFVKGMDV